MTLTAPLETPTLYPFTIALGVLKAGGRVQRKGWNGKGMHLAMVPADSWDVDGAISRHPDTGVTKRLPWIGMLTADQHFVPWLASQTDILAEDWVLLVEP